MFMLRVDLALALIRIMLGLVCTLHGSQKVLGAFGGPGLQGFVNWIGSLGVPAVLGYLAAFFEFAGGLLLLFGIASRLGAAMVIPVMLGAIYLVHLKNGFFTQNGGYEYPLVLLVMALALVIGGSGSLTLMKFME